MIQGNVPMKKSKIIHEYSSVCLELQNIMVTINISKKLICMDLLSMIIGELRDKDI